ncbi:MAG: alpha/beta hydrolase [Nitrospirae bacterium]|nr:alpha/beta hydrolase [Nitrospirota bacterium]
MCAAAALLAVLEAPTHLLWMVALGVTEWGHWLGLLSLLLLLRGWHLSWNGLLGFFLSLLAALLAVTPLLRAIPVAHRLPIQLEIAFGDAAPRSLPETSPRPAPLVPADLLLGVDSPTGFRQSLVYGMAGGQELRLDLYQPSTYGGLHDPDTGAPGIVVIHGGSWQSGDKSQLLALNRYLAARGYLVAAINYRLAPRWPFPAARDDVVAALAYLKGHASDLGLDPNRLALLGRSAGGQLALLVAYTAEDPAIRGVVAFYTPADMRYGYANPGNPAVIDSRGILEAYLGGSPNYVPDVYDAASPLNFVDARTPATLLIHGGRDEFVLPAQSERLAARLAQAGRPHFLLRLPWATHGCDANFSGPCGQLSTYAIERFLAAVMP